MEKLLHQPEWGGGGEVKDLPNPVIVSYFSLFAQRRTRCLVESVQLIPKDYFKSQE